MLRPTRSFFVRLTDKYGIGFFVYGGVSVVSALSEWLIFVLALSSVGPVIASLAGFVGATCLNYVLSHYFAFRSTRPFLQEFALVMFMSGLAFIANFLVFYFLYTNADVHVLFAKIIGTCSGFFFNYAARQFYVFSRVPRFPSVSHLMKHESRDENVNMPMRGTANQTVAGNPILSPPSKRSDE